MTIPGSSPSDDATLDTRTRLREAALDRFGRKGVKRTSTREVIAAAGLRNPSAINYYFGTKERLVEDLVREVNVEQSAIIQRQVALARQAPPPTVTQWAAAAVDAATGLLATERGCLLICVWADHDESNPDAVEEFLAGDHPLARSWRDAVIATVPDMAPIVAIARNVVLLRTLQWITVRRARRILRGDQPSWATDPTVTGPFLLELALNILAPPTTIRDTDLLDL